MEMVALLHPHEHADLARAQLLRAKPGVLERAPGLLQQQALPRIHALGLERRDFEEQGVEFVHARNGAEAMVARAETLRGGRGNRLTACDEVAPELGDAA